MISARVPGIPIPQGSMRGFVRGGKAIVTSDNLRLRSWRADVAAVLQAARNGHAQLTGPVNVWLSFFLPRPQSHYGKRGIRHSAPARPIGARDDLDKLCRAVLDAATAAGVWRDDGQVVYITADKSWADDEGPGVAVTIEERE